MRKLILSASISLDGYVEGPNGDMSWMQVDNDQEWDDLFESLNKVDLFILGSGMWTDYSSHWKKQLVDPGAPANEVKYAKIADKTPHIVFSKTLKDAGWDNTTINNGDLAAEVEKLKEQPGKDIMTFGGAKFVASLLDSGLVDEYRLAINPAILAGGKSSFNLLKKSQKLQLESVKQIGQLVVLTYKQL
ncbi:dihydrofolate reductase family protein [Mucilaginibacter sp. AK015]|uniref:dihydrofolate reductase family protein n=1 Tax=Mucilaginibacter sp. AK015 TaxID=2723072 RepID=UPI001612343E|nr:dihydrofolate reductase family protein [Mucilaginibacter sp. AK015]MBB5396738.1 dihydrofolate reductase [Mucilaginibacter sp. AK015]